MGQAGTSVPDIILDVMLAMAAADGEIEDREAATIAGIYRDLTGRDLSQDVIRTRARSRRAAAPDIVEWLQGVVPSLDRDAKDQIVRAAYLVLLADDAISSAERKKLQDIAAALKIPEVHFGAILEDVAVWLQQQAERGSQ